MIDGFSRWAEDPEPPETSRLTFMALILSRVQILFHLLVLHRLRLRLHLRRRGSRRMRALTRRSRWKRTVHDIFSAVIGKVRRDKAILREGLRRAGTLWVPPSARCELARHIHGGRRRAVAP
jgi:hypothetical protein